MKECFNCKELLQESDFPKNARFRDGLNKNCDKCTKERLKFIKDNPPPEVPEGFRFCRPCSRVLSLDSFSNDNSRKVGGKHYVCKECQQERKKKERYYEYVDFKECCQCEMIKHRDDFHPRKTTITGLRNECIMCTRMNNKEEYWRDIDKSKQDSKKWRIKRGKRILWAEKTLWTHRVELGVNIITNTKELAEFSESHNNCNFCGQELFWQIREINKHSPNSPCLENLYCQDFLTLSDIAITCFKCNTIKSNRTLDEYIKYLQSFLNNIDVEKKYNNNTHTDKNIIKNQIVWSNRTIYYHSLNGIVCNFLPKDLQLMAIKSFNCDYCRKELDWSGGKRRHNTPSLENIDLKTELFLEDISIVCWECNSTKSNRTLRDFIEYCKKILPNLIQLEVSRRIVPESSSSAIQDVQDAHSENPNTSVPPGISQPHLGM